MSRNGNRKIYASEVLCGLTEIPVSGNPGTMIVTGSKSQPVYFGDTSEDVFLAAAEYGNGRVFVATHECYNAWMIDTHRDLEKQLMNNVKKWLTKQKDVENVKIFDSKDINEDTNFDEYQLVKWEMSHHLSENNQEQLLKYLKNGGALLTSATPWAYGQLFPNKTLDDMSMHLFLKNNFGISFTMNYLALPEVIPIDIGKVEKVVEIYFRKELQREPSSSYFDREILCGLSEIKTPTCPGSLIITGFNAQAVFTGEKSSDVFLAAAEYGRGRVFVAAHESYTEWLKSPTDKLETDLTNNIKNWLSQKSKAQIVTMCDISTIKESSGLSQYDFVKWGMCDSPSETIQEKVLEYIDNGGGLFAAATPWAYSQIFPNKVMDDMPLYRFLRTHFGIIFTNDYLNLSDTTAVAKNDAKHGTFRRALIEVGSNAQKLNKYISTIDKGIEMIETTIGDGDDESTVRKLLQNLVEELNLKGSSVCPQNGKPVQNEQDKELCKMYCNCLIASFNKNKKAPFIDDFPGDFAESTPTLLTNVSLNIEAEFEERISTGYYLPAGVLANVKVNNSDDLKMWKIRIGAHSDNIANCNEYMRWPVITIVHDLKDGMEISSPFGGLVYFER